MKQPTFYMATDDQSLAHIQKQIGIIGLDIKTPKNKMQEEILAIIS